MSCFLIVSTDIDCVCIDRDSGTDASPKWIWWTVNMSHDPSLTESTAWMIQVIAVSVWFTICFWTKISKIYEYLQYSVPFPYKIFIFLFQMYDTLGSWLSRRRDLVVIVNRKTCFRFRWNPYGNRTFRSYWRFAPKLFAPRHLSRRDV